jgi:hypothetical protein
MDHIIKFIYKIKAADSFYSSIAVKTIFQNRKFTK